MSTAVRSRPHTAVGVAMVAAGALAISPMAPPMPDIQATFHRAVSSAKVELDAVVSPLESLTNLLFTSAGNLTALGTQFVNDPAPILGQLITNQGANAAVIGTGLQQTIDFYSTTIPQIPAQLQMIADQLRAGDVSGAVNTVFQIPLGLALPIALFALPPIFQVTTNAAQNFANVVAALPNAALPLGLSAITPIFAATSVFGDQAQEIVDAVGSGSLATAAGAALSTPTELVNAFLNGTGVVDGSPGDVQNPGILTPGTNGGGFNPGLLAGLLNLRDTIAGALDPVPAPLGLASVSSVPKANTATLKLADSDASASPASPASPAIPSPKLRRNSPFRSLVAAKPTPGTASSTSSVGGEADSSGADAGSNGADAGSSGADASGRHRAHPDNPVGSVVKKLRDSASHASGAPRHARAEHSTAD